MRESFLYRLGYFLHELFEWIHVLLLILMVLSAFQGDLVWTVANGLGALYFRPHPSYVIRR